MQATMIESRERIRREREREKNTYTSPRLALRRVLLLAEGRQFREAAAILSRLGPGVLMSVASELPMDLLVESLPHSSHLIETLLNRLIALEVSPRPELECEAVAWRLAGLGDSRGGSRLPEALRQYAPRLPTLVDDRRRQLDGAVQGLGTHGLTADNSGSLVSLHAAIKSELQRHIDTFKQALHKLEEMSPVTINQDPASSSHQRLLSLSHSDVERRLIDNKSLLTIIDKPALKQLPTLVEALAQRVESDKAVMACVGLVKRSDPGLDLNDIRPIAGVLMSYSRGCAAVLSQMSVEESPSVTGTPTATATDSASDGYHSDSDESNHMNDRNAVVSLYARAWGEAARCTLPALAALQPLQHTPLLKYKIVFSIAVLSFRAAISLRDKRLREVKAALGITGEDKGGTETDGNLKESVAALDAAARRLLQHTAATYPLEEAEEQVLNQVCATLREFPLLSSRAAAASLRALCSRAARAAFALSAQRRTLALHTDFSPVKLNPSLHVRLPSDSSPRSDDIKSFVWPALMDGGRCVFRAIVIT